MNCGWRYALVIADNVFVHVLQRDFGIPAHEFIACAGGAVAQGVPVVVGPIRIARVVVNDHVIDKAVNIEVLFDLVVLRVVGQARVDQRHHRRPGNVISRDHLEEALRVAHHVVLGIIAAIVSGGKFVVRPLVDIIYTPVKSIEIEVHEAPVRGGVVHLQLEIAAELVADQLSLSPRLLELVVPTHIEPRRQH